MSVFCSVLQKDYNTLFTFLIKHYSTTKENTSVLSGDPQSTGPQSFDVCYTVSDTSKVRRAISSH